MGSYMGSFNVLTRFVSHGKKKKMAHCPKQWKRGPRIRAFNHVQSNPSLQAPFKKKKYTLHTIILNIQAIGETNQPLMEFSLKNMAKLLLAPHTIMNRNASKLSSFK